VLDAEGLGYLDSQAFQQGIKKLVRVIFTRPSGQTGAF
jgi:hypothetical protein